MRSVPREIAMHSMTTHSFQRGVGYVSHGGPPATVIHVASERNCDPPVGTKDGTAHTLRTAGGSTLEMIWVAAEHAWAGPAGRGNRLAWTAEHLSLAGWSYLGWSNGRS